MKKLLIIGTVAVCALLAHGEDDDDAYTCAGLIPAPPPPTPEEIEAEFQTTLATAQSISWDDSDITNLLARTKAIQQLEAYANTNVLGYLSTVWRNPEDSAQYDALRSAIGTSLAAGGDEWRDIVLEVATNQYGYARVRKLIVYESGAREREWPSATAAYLILKHERHEDDRFKYACRRQRPTQAIRENIEAFVDERLLVATDNEGVEVDILKCIIESNKEQTPNPSYRHSQQRRDNLSRAHGESLLGNGQNTPGKWNEMAYANAMMDAQPQK